MHEEFCQDYGDRPGCLRDPDPYYTMDYRDVKGGRILYWCKHCGPLAKAMEEAITEVCKVPGMAKELETAIAKAEDEQSRALEEAMK